MKIILLIPIYNDRESLKKLIENINFEVKDLNSEMSVVVINDASSQQIVETYQNLENINSFEIINMKENKGHARCIASGLKYIFEKKNSIMSYLWMVMVKIDQKRSKILFILQNNQTTNP